MSDDFKISNLLFYGNVNADNKTASGNKYNLSANSSSAKSSEDELVEYKGSVQVEVLQKRRDREIEKYFTYQDRIVELERKKARYEEKIEKFKDKPQRAQRYQAKLSRINAQISEYTQKCNGCETNMEQLSSQIESELENITKETSKTTYEQQTYAAVPLSASNTKNTGSNIQLLSSPAPVSYNATPYTGNSIPNQLASALDRKLGTGFANKCEQVAKYLNCNVNDLLAMMYSESGINPQAGNPNGGAVGLIQFMPSVLSGNGYSSAQVRNMNGIQQLDLVAEFLMKSKKMAGYGQNDKIDAGTLYAMCFLPAVARSEILCTSGGKLGWAYKANSGLDMDKDGSISKSDLARRLSKKYQELNTYFV